MMAVLVGKGGDRPASSFFLLRQARFFQWAAAARSAAGDPSCVRAEDEFIGWVSGMEKMGASISNRAQLSGFLLGDTDRRILS